MFNFKNDFYISTIYYLLEKGFGFRLSYSVDDQIIILEENKSWEILEFGLEKGSYFKKLKYLDSIYDYTTRLPSEDEIAKFLINVIKPSTYVNKENMFTLICHYFDNKKPFAFSYSNEPNIQDMLHNITFIEDYIRIYTFTNKTTEITSIDKFLGNNK